jgi:hypothetical protein
MPFRFDHDTHTYVELGTGRELQHVTGMLKRTGWRLNDQWCTEADRLRGEIVHQLTAEYDLGVLTVAECDHPLRGYLVAYVTAITILQLRILAVEEALVHPRLRFGGRPDRVIADAGVVGCLEIKSGDPDRSHPIQTALQAILLEPELSVPAQLQRRLVLYVKGNGKFKVREHREPGDIVVARQIIQICTT